MSSEFTSRIDRLEGRIEKVERKKRDLWDVVQIVVIPLTVALAGFFVSRAIASAQVASSDRIAEQQIEVARINTRIEEGKLISTYLEALVSPDSQRRTLALEAIRLVSPEDGDKFLQIVARSDPSAQVRSVATVAARDRLSLLLDDAFSNDSSTRKAAARNLVESWGSNAALIPGLLDRAEQHLDNENAIYNVLLILEYPDRRLMLQNRARVERFLQRIAALPDRPQTQARVERIRARYRRADAAGA